MVPVGDAVRVGTTSEVSVLVGVSEGAIELTISGVGVFVKTGDGGSAVAEDVSDGAGVVLTSMVVGAAVGETGYIWIGTNSVQAATVKHCSYWAIPVEN